MGLLLGGRGVLVRFDGPVEPGRRDEGEALGGVLFAKARELGALGLAVAAPVGPEEEERGPTAEVRQPDLRAGEGFLPPELRGSLAFERQDVEVLADPRPEGGVLRAGELSFEEADRRAPAFRAEAEPSFDLDRRAERDDRLRSLRGDLAPKLRDPGGRLVALAEHLGAASEPSDGVEVLGVDALREPVGLDRRLSAREVGGRELRADPLDQLGGLQGLGDGRGGESDGEGRGKGNERASVTVHRWPPREMPDWQRRAAVRATCQRVGVTYSRKSRPDPAFRYTRGMRTKPLLAVALLAIGCPSFAIAQGRLPADWEQKVATVVKEPERARKVVEAGRQHDAKRQASLDVMKSAEADVRAAFLNQASSVGERQLSVSLLRDDRRKASLAVVDSLLAVRPLVSSPRPRTRRPSPAGSRAGR